MPAVCFVDEQCTGNPRYISAFFLALSNPAVRVFSGKQGEWLHLQMLSFAVGAHLLDLRHDHLPSNGV